MEIPTPLTFSRMHTQTGGEKSKRRMSTRATTDHSMQYVAMTTIEPLREGLVGVLATILRHIAGMHVLLLFLQHTEPVRAALRAGSCPRWSTRRGGLRSASLRVAEL